MGKWRTRRSSISAVTSRIGMSGSIATTLALITSRTIMSLLAASCVARQELRQRRAASRPAPSPGSFRRRCVVQVPPRRSQRATSASANRSGWVPTSG
jgi:hypothetical protein